MFYYCSKLDFVQALGADEVGKITDTGLAALAEACPGLQVRAIATSNTTLSVYYSAALLLLALEYGKHQLTSPPISSPLIFVPVIHKMFLNTIHR